nr:hypothetical protein [Tanacetum cinerariifolium]
VADTSVPSLVEDYSDIGSPEVDGPPSSDYEDPEEDPADYHVDFTVVALPVVDHVPSKELRGRGPRQDEPAVARDDPYSLVREELYGFVDRDTTIMYGMMEDAQDDRSQLRGRVNLLYRDRPVHHRLAVMIEREVMMAREAWGLSMDASDNAHSDVMSLRTTLVAQHALILDLQATNRRRHGVIKELLAADHKRQVQLTKALRLLKGLQTQMIEFSKHHGPTKGLAQPDALGEAGSSS